MENLPADIEQKIEQLPIYRLDDTENLMKVIQSNLFFDIFAFYKNNYMLNQKYIKECHYI